MNEEELNAHYKGKLIREKSSGYLFEVMEIFTLGSWAKESINISLRDPDKKTPLMGRNNTLTPEMIINDFELV